MRRARRPPAGRAAIAAALVATLLVPVAAAAATSGGTGDGGTGNPSALPEDVLAELADDDARIAAATPTDAMHDDATVPLRPDDATLSLQPDDATLPLRPDDATTTLESTREGDDATVVTLTSDLLFAFDSADLSDAATAALTDLVDQVPDGAAVAVDGHTDSKGTDERNDELSRERAEAVADVLRTARPDLALTVTGHGSGDPVAENTVDGADNPAGRALNRRVELAWDAP